MIKTSILFDGWITVNFIREMLKLNSIKGSGYTWALLRWKGEYRADVIPIFLGFFFYSFRAPLSATDESVNPLSSFLLFFLRFFFFTFLSPFLSLFFWFLSPFPFPFSFTNEGITSEEGYPTARQCWVGSMVTGAQRGGSSSGMLGFQEAHPVKQ